MDEDQRRQAAAEGMRKAQQRIQLKELLAQGVECVDRASAMFSGMGHPSLAEEVDGAAVILRSAIAFVELVDQNMTLQQLIATAHATAVETERDKAIASEVLSEAQASYNDARARNDQAQERLSSLRHQMTQVQDSLNTNDG